MLRSNDQSLFSDFFIAFGGSDPAPAGNEEDAFLRIFVDAPTPDSWGQLRLWHAGALLPCDRFFFGLELPNCPYVRLNEAEADGAQIAFRGEELPQFVYAGTECKVRWSPVWCQAVIALIWRGFMSLIDEAIFFHAASVGIGGRGFFFAGTQHSGKSTLALALASRGHDFLGDDIACYLPSPHLMLPYRRPVGIREGPRAAAVTDALRTRTYRSIQQDDSLRVDVVSLLALGVERAFPVDGVVFLQGFAPRPLLRQIEAGPEKISRLQALHNPLLNGSPGRRLAELIRLTSRARMFELVIGDPDETASHVEEVLSA